MSNPLSPVIVPAGKMYRKETLINGVPGKIDCMDIGGQTFSLSRGLLTVARLEDEWYEDIADPEAVIAALATSAAGKPDLFTFWQRLPEVEPSYPFYYEWEEIAALPVTSYSHWWQRQLKPNARNKIRKAENSGLLVRETVYDDNFITGMTAIFNETPIRQGRRFWHYGKDFATVKQQFSRYLFREYMIGAYYEDEMIGFMMLGDAGRMGIAGQIVASVRHRDKAPSNALIAKAVELCEQKKLDYLVYAFWGNDTLTAFKHYCGFEKTSIPRYYVPLTAKGKWALKYGIHHGWREWIPDAVKIPLKRLRKTWYELN